MLFLISLSSARMYLPKLTIVDGIILGVSFIFVALIMALVSYWVICLFKMSSKDRTKVFLINFASKVSWMLLIKLGISLIELLGIDKSTTRLLNGAYLVLSILSLSIIEGYIYKKVINYTKINGRKLSLLINVVLLLIIGCLIALLQHIDIDVALSWNLN